MRARADELSGRLAPFRARIRLLLSERFLCWGVAIAVALAFILVVIDFLSLFYVTPELLGGLLLLGAAAGAIYGATRPLPDLAVAMTVERRQNLKERASTAVTLVAHPERSPELRNLIIDDAIQHLSGLLPAVLFPLRFARRHKIPLAIWSLVVLLFLLPAINPFQSKAVRAERKALQAAGTTIKEAAKEIQHDPELKANKTARNIAKKMYRLGVELEKNRIPKKDALVRLNKLEQQLQTAEKQVAKEQAQRDRQGMAAMAKAARDALHKRAQTEKDAAARARARLAAGTPKEQLAKQERAALAREQRLTALAQHAEQQDMTGAARDLQQMGEELQNDSTMTPEQRQELSQSLQQMSKGMSPSPSGQQMSKGMQQASQQLKSGTQQGQQQASQRLRTIPLPPSLAPGAPSMSNARQSTSMARQGVASNKPCPNPGQSAQGGKQSSGTKSGSGMEPLGGGKSGSGNCNGKSGSNGNASGSNNGTAGPGQGGTGGTGNGGGNRNGRADGRLPAGFTPNQETPDSDPAQEAYSVDVRGAPGEGARSNVPYADIYTGYQRSAESAIANEQVPANERQRVKDYFTRLDPSGTR